MIPCRMSFRDLQQTDSIYEAPSAS
jgi:hypothetical protein